MTSSSTRYVGAAAPIVAEGWRIERLTPPSRLFGANGIRTGADGRIYVAQVTGSQISAIDPSTGAIEVISPMGGPIVGPDDLVFDPAGNLFITEFTEGRVSMRAPNGDTRVIHGDMPGANPITFHNGRLFAGECRPGARIMELDRDGGSPRVLLDNVPMANAMEVGPDGKLYFPVMGTNEIWRIDLDGGAPEVVAGALGVPDAVKFDAAGFIVSTQVASGQVLRIDPRSGDREVLADVAPGLDNLTFVDDRLFVSRFTGEIVEILAGGAQRPLIDSGLNWPMGLAARSDGSLYVADGGFLYSLARGGALRGVGMMFTPGFPGYLRGIAAMPTGELVITTALGGVARYWPAECRSEVIFDGLDRPNGVALTSAGDVIVAEGGTGRVLSIRGGQIEELASGLSRPMGVTIGSDGMCYVSDAGAGRVVVLTARGTDTVVDGLIEPHGVCVSGDKLYILDVGAKALLSFDIAAKTHTTLASLLPVGAPQGISPKALHAIPPIAGPMGPFADVTLGADGEVFISGDADGSVLALRRTRIA